MAALLKNKQVLVVAVVVVALLASEASAAITCGQVDSSIAPCVSYATGKGKLTPGCCNGVRGLNSAARTTADRQAACRCLKSLAGTMRRINMGAVSGIPGKCGVSVSFPISMSTNCDTYVVVTFSSRF
jgi:hypothetical protein